MTTYILIVYLWAGGKMAYPFRFQTLAACQAEAEAQLEHGEAVAGTVCVEARHTRMVKK
jgi:hypothetical protein